MRVDEAGRDRAARGVEPGEPAERVALRLEQPLDLGARADRGDPALPAGDDRRVDGHAGPPTVGGGDGRPRPGERPARRPPAIVTTSAAPTISRPGRRLVAPAALDDAERPPLTAGPVGPWRPPAGPPPGGAPGPASARSRATAGTPRRPRGGRSTGSSAGAPARSATARNAASGASPISSDSASSTPSSAAIVADGVPDQPQRRDREVEEVHRDLCAAQLLDPEAVAPGPWAGRHPTRGRGGRSAWRAPRRRSARLML